MVHFIPILPYIGFGLMLLSGYFILYPTFQFFKWERKSRYPLMDRPKKNHPLFNHMDLILKTIFNRSSHFLVMTFFFITFLIFSLSLAFFIVHDHSALRDLFFSVGLAALPYTLLRLRLRGLRITSSYEGQSMISELASQYKVNFFNMQEAIDQTITRLGSDHKTRKMLIRLSIALKEVQELADLQTAISDFVFAVDTNWAILLGNNIYSAIKDYENVVEALDDILDSLRDAKIIQENAKRENMETNLLIRYLSPLAFVASIYAIIHFMGITWAQYKQYQFQTTEGLHSFEMTVFSIACGWVIMSVINKPKNDI